MPSDSQASTTTGPSTGPARKQPPVPPSASGAPPITVAATPLSRSSQATIPTIVLLPLVPATATPGRPALTTSASSAGRGTVSTPRVRAARISGVSASTALE